MSDQSQKLIEAANLLCEVAMERLPDGYRLELVIENGEASINLEDPNCDNIEVYGDRRSSWLEAIEAAEEHAKGE